MFKIKKTIKRVIEQYRTVERLKDLVKNRTFVHAAIITSQMIRITRVIK